MAQVVEGIPAGHSYRAIAIDLEAAREYEARVKRWFETVKRAMADADVGWTAARAKEVAHLLETELLVDWEEVIELVRSKNTGPGQGRIEELDAAKNRAQSELVHELDLLVLAQDRTRIPIDEQLLAPRYRAVQVSWEKAKTLLDGPQPDFPNAAKEAVSAVEQLARIVTAQASATLGDAIKDLRKSGRIAAPLLKGLEEIWGWASDTPSVRHGASSTIVVDSSAASYIVSLSAAAIALLLSTDAA